MDQILLFIISATIIIVTLVVFSKLIKEIISKLLLFLLNGLGGLILLLILVYVFGIGIPVALATVLVVIIFGLPGLGCLLILHYFGMI